MTPLGTTGHSRDTDPSPDVEASTDSACVGSWAVIGYDIDGRFNSLEDLLDLRHDEPDTGKATDVTEVLYVMRPDGCDLGGELFQFDEDGNLLMDLTGNEAEGALAVFGRS